MNTLAAYGWTNDFHEKWRSLKLPHTQPARVTADFGTSLKIAAPHSLTAELSGKLAHYSSRENVPKVGDWVAVTVSDNGHAVIEATIPRRSEIARKVAGKQTVKQVIAANVDIAFVLLALDSNFNIERLKRFLYQLSINAIEPIIVLNKADKVADIALYVDQLRVVNLPIIISTATTGEGVEEIRSHIQPGHTAILLGSSGVGKSTLTNQLLGRDAQKTQAIRASDETGKHTTVHRELFVLSGGGLLIDTPGIRELQLWGTQDDLNNNFDDIAELAHLCKYTTCRHTTEPGCAIQAALRSGALDASHYDSYTKMKAELTTLEAKSTARLKRGDAKTHKKLSKQRQDILNDSREQMSE
jgi:ribosome biogenesis GTPase